MTRFHIVMSQDKILLIAGLAIFAAMGSYVLWGPSSNKRKKIKNIHGVKGLVNMGETCFLNTLLQALAACPIFYQWIERHQDMSKLAPALLQVIDVVNCKDLSEGEYYPRAVVSALSAHGWTLGVGQQDSHELFLALLSSLEEQILPPSKPLGALELLSEDVPTKVSLQVHELGVNSLDVTIEKEQGNIDGIESENDIPSPDCSASECLTNLKNINVISKPNISSNLNDDVAKEIESSIIQNFVQEEEKKCGLKINTQTNKSVNQLNAHGDCYNIEVDSNGSAEPHASITDDVYGFPPLDGITEEFGSVPPQNKTENSNNKSYEECDSSKLVIDSNLKNPTENKDDENAKFSPKISSNEVKSEIFGSKNEPISRMQPSILCRSGPPRPTLLQRNDFPFRGQQLSQLCCTVCNTASVVQHQAFDCLSLTLPLRGLSTLEQLLSSFTAPEQVHGVECERCSTVNNLPTKTVFVKQLTIGRLPKCLCIHIQRTTWLNNGEAYKRQDFVAFPEILDMEAFTYCRKERVRRTLLKQLAESCEGSGDVMTSKEQQNKLNGEPRLLGGATIINAPQSTPIKLKYKPRHLYQLQAVVVHLGEVSSGHFVTYRRGPPGTADNQRWIWTSDQQCEPATLAEVMRARAYMLFYEKMSATFS